MATATPVDQRARDRICTDLGVNLCVEAGAGTGKTRSLISRVVELLATGAATVDELVVITFTEKAAAELSARVREELEVRFAKEADAERSTRLSDAIRGLYRAHIETIHAFAASILRERPVEAGLDPEFGVLGGLESGLTFDRAYDEWLKQLLEDDHPEIERAFNLGFGADEIRETAKQLNDFRFLLPLGELPAPKVETKDLVDWLDENLDELRAIEGRCTDEEDKGAAQLRRLFEFAEQLEIEGTTDAARDRLVAAGAPSLKQNRGSRNSWEDPGDCDRMKELVCEYDELRDGLKEGLRSAAMLDVLPHVEGFVRTYEQSRRADGFADYDDLLIWARNLLRDNLEVRRYFQRRYRAILIDEFQDTDPIQVEIAIFLASDGQDATEWRTLDPVPGKMFVVGDPKQSIYRFRRADIAIYDAVKRGVLGDGLVELAQNFRSTGPVIEWLNHRFNELLIEKEGIQPANVPLQPRELEHLPDPERPSVTVIRRIDEDLKADDVRESEAQSVAAVLKKGVNAGWQVRDATGELRDASWRDIAILLPARTGLEAYEQALANADVPYRHEGSRDYFRRQEVRDLISLLHAIDDPTDKLSVVGALRSAAFGCSDDDLVIHRATGRTLDYRPDSESESERVRTAFEMLRELHYLRGRRTLPELVQTVLEESRLVEFTLAQRDGPQAAANLLAVADQARSFSAAGGGGLRAFTRWLTDSTDNEALEIDAGIAEETDNVVRILTMHGAKGLEFPIVVLANLGGRPQLGRGPVPDEESHLLHFRVGSGGRTGHFTTPGYEERWEDEQETQDAERIRLLYVAATRARDHLIVPHFRAKLASHSLLAPLEPLLPEEDGHEIEVDGTWLLDAEQIEPIELEEEKRRRPRKSEVREKLEQREEWSGRRDELLKDAGEELELTIASSLERPVRPLAAEASHSASTLIVSEGPPLPIGDALHLVMQRVSLSSADDLDQVVESVCAEAGLPDHAHDVRQLAVRCLESPTVKRAIASGAYRREVPFTVPWNGGFATGRVDLVFTGGDDLVAVDYKTDAIEARHAEKHAANNHSGQAEVYARALTHATGLPVPEVVFVFCRTDAEVSLQPQQ